MIQSSVKYTELEDRLDPGYYRPEFLAYSKTYKYTLDDFVKIKNGFPYSSSLFGIGDMPFIRIRDFDATGIDYPNIVYLPARYVGECKPYYPSPGDIILGMDGDAFRAALLYEDKKLAINQRIAIIRSEGIAPEVIYALLNSEFGQNYFKRYSTFAGTVGHISNSIIKKMPVPDHLIDKENEIVIQVKSMLEDYRSARENFVRLQNLVNTDPS